jgi:hypothetical protein
MTNPAPAPKASSAAALLASLPTNPPKTAQPVTADFLSIILHALGTKNKESSDPTSATEPSANKQKSTTDAKTGTDAADSSGLLLTLLALSAAPLPQLPKLPKFAPPKAGTASIKTTETATPKVDTKANDAAPESEDAPLAKKLAPGYEKPKPGVTPDATDGTSAAISGQRMNIVARKNEVAGQAEQKLPLGAVSSASAVTGVEAPAAPGQDSGRKSLDFSWKEASPETVALVNLTAKAADAPASEAASAPAAASPAERVEQMISREVVTIRQTGAQTLGVSLKVDDNTQLFLQLTTENGQIQASLRLEKGDFTALNSQWTQLQESLARQNVQLMPASGSSSFNFQQSSQQQQQQRQLPQPREEWPQANLGVPPAQTRQQKNPNARRSRQDWETWA